MSKNISLFIFLVLNLFINNSIAGLQEARALRNLIELKDQSILENIRSTIKLRTTRGFNQGGSQLCWIFATLNMLETNYLEKHLQIAPSDVELSRFAIGHFYAQGSRGTSIDAINFYIDKYGLVMNEDFQIGEEPPSQTTFLDELIPVHDLSRIFLKEDEFFAYGFHQTKRGWHPHPDPDAFSQTEAYFLDKTKFKEVVITSLKSEISVTYTHGGHILQIYGVSLDDSGNPVSYFIKDSYPNYFYEASASRVHKFGFVVTTSKRFHTPCIAPF